MNIRKATAADIDGIEKIYDDIHTAEERGEQTIGWIRGVYPVRATAEAGLQRGDLYVMEEDGELLGTAIINDIQVDVYKGGKWDCEAADDEVCVLHTLVISPYAKDRDCGRTFVKFYEDYALQHGRHELRIDPMSGTRRQGLCIRSSDIRRSALFRPRLTGYLMLCL